MASVTLRQVHAEYQLLSVRDYNLKNRLVQAARHKMREPVLIQALRSVDLDIPEGARLGLVGANGAGKSTMLSIMAGLLPPTSGKVLVEGRVLALLGGAEAGLDQEASGAANVISMGVQLGESPVTMRSRVEDITEFSGLGERILHPVYSYSSGMQTRLRFSILTSLRPDVLLLDEGLGMADAEFTARASLRLKEFLSGAGILVLASHGDSLLQEQCTSAIWLRSGAIVGQGSVDDVLANYHASHTAEVSSP